MLTLTIWLLVTDFIGIIALNLEKILRTMPSSVIGMTIFVLSGMSLVSDLPKY